MSDRIFGAIGLILSLFFIWQATRIELSFISDPVGPRTFPIIICVMMALASAVVLLVPDPEPLWPAAMSLFEIGVSVVVLFLYASLLPVVGFIIATAFAAAYLTRRLGSTPVQSAIIGIATSIGIFVVFKLILGLSLAEGPFGF